MIDSPDSQHERWHSRLYLPHFDAPAHIQTVTFRLADALPVEVARSLALESDSPSKRARVYALLDAGHGACLLGDPAIAKIVEDALLFHDGDRYQIIAWCLMPNHVHVLIRQKVGFRLGQIVHSWKSFTAKSINSRTGKTGRVWHPDYFDRFIRDERHLQPAIAYIEENPVKAGLVSVASDWPWSSSRRRLD
jgi:putative transposase